MMELLWYGQEVAASQEACRTRLFQLENQGPPAGDHETTLMKPEALENLPGFPVFLFHFA